jgi:hypothetical protein
MIVKKHVVEGKLLLALCDDSLLGKKFEDDTKQLDISSSFYNGVTMKIEQLLLLLEEAYIINAVGSETIDFLKQQGFKVENVIAVQGIPHAQIIIEPSV